MLCRFLQAQSYAGFICFVAWASSSVAHPPAKRAVALAWINTVSSLGNVFGSYVDVHLSAGLSHLVLKVHLPHGMGSKLRQILRLVYFSKLLRAGHVLGL